MEPVGLRVKHDVCVDRLVERFDAARIATVDIAFPIHFCCVPFMVVVPSGVDGTKDFSMVEPMRG